MQKKLFNQDRIKFMKNSLLIDNEILVFGDFHIGIEEHIAGEGLIPRVQLKEIMDDLVYIFNLLDKQKIKLKKIIILGDLKHEFGGISDSEWRNVLKVLDYLEEKIGKDNEIILIKGNHDNIIGPIARKKKIKLKNYYKYKDIFFIHGDKEYKRCLEKEVKILIFGHLHPSVSLKEENKKEKYKCFLKGKWKKKIVYILPSFSSISFGYDLTITHKINNGEGNFLIIPEKNLNKFDVLIYNDKENKIHDFRKLKKLR